MAVVHRLIRHVVPFGGTRNGVRIVVEFVIKVKVTHRWIVVERIGWVLLMVEICLGKVVATWIVARE